MREVEIERVKVEEVDELFVAAEFSRQFTQIMQAIVLGNSNSWADQLLAFGNRCSTDVDGIANGFRIASAYVLVKEECTLAIALPVARLPGATRFYHRDWSFNLIQKLEDFSKCPFPKSQPWSCFMIEEVPKLTIVAHEHPWLTCATHANMQYDSFPRSSQVALRLHRTGRAQS